MNVSGLVKVTSIKCSRNLLTELDLSGDTSLTRVYFRSNQVSDLTIDGCVNLEHIKGPRNRLTSLDVSGFSNLNQIQISHNSLTSLNISNCDPNIFVAASNNNLERVDGLNTLNSPGLKLFNNFIDFERAVKYYVQYGEEDMDNQNFYPAETIALTDSVDLSAYDTITASNVKYATSFELRKVLDDVLVETNNTGVFKFTEDGVYYVRLNNAAGVRSVTNHITVGAGGPINSTDYNDADSLALLEIINNNFDEFTNLNWETETDMSNWEGVRWSGTEPLQVERLRLGKVGLVGDIDLTALSIIDEIQVQGNFLTSVEVSGLSDLTDLRVARNSLTELDLTGLTSLQDLYAKNNLLTSLDFTGLSSLDYVKAESNKISSITGIADATALVSLYLDDNALVSLDLRNNTTLERLYARNNLLESIQGVLNISTLERLYVEGNYFPFFRGVKYGNHPDAISDVQPQYTLGAQTVLLGGTVDYQEDSVIAVNGVDQTTTFTLYDDQGAQVEQNNTGLFTMNTAGTFYIILSNSGVSYTTGDITVQETASIPSVSVTSLDFGTSSGQTVEKTITITNDGNAELSVTGITLPDGYSVVDETFTVAAGASSQLVVSFNPTDNQVYDGNMLISTDAPGQSDFFVALTGTGENITGLFGAYTSNYVLYPNPSTDFVTIEGLTQGASVVLYNMMGQEVLVSELETLNISELPSGVYLVSINGKMQSDKLVKE